MASVSADGVVTPVGTGTTIITAACGNKSTTATVNVGDTIITDTSTIQAAIDAASNKDTILVQAGTYTEDVTVNKPVTLIGAGCGDTTIVGATIGGPGSNESTLKFDTDNATVRGFTITHTYTPAELANWNFNNNGVQFNQGTTGNTLENCCVTLNRNGVYLNNCQGNEVKNNTINNNRIGLNLWNNIGSTAITGNTVSDNWGLGFSYIQFGMSPGTNFGSVNVSGNTFSENWYSEVLIRNTQNSTGTLNVTNNTFTDVPVTYTTSDDASLNHPDFSAQQPVILGGSDVKPAEDLPTLRIYNSPNVTLQYDGKTLLVDGAGTNATAYDTIQKAVNIASDGDIISVAAGTYALNSQLAISKPITITGVGAVVIEPSAGYTAGTYFDWHLVGITNSSGTVTLNNLTVQNSLQNGITAREAANVQLTDITVINNTGAGLFVNGSTVTATNLTASGNGTSWGSVRVGPAGGVISNSTFTLVSGTLSDTAQIYSEGAGGTVVAVNAPADYSQYLVDGTTDHFIWSNAGQPANTTPVP